jgi:hypothetical protein
VLRDAPEDAAAPAPRLGFADTRRVRYSTWYEFTVAMRDLYPRADCFGRWSRAPPPPPPPPPPPLESATCASKEARDAWRDKSTRREVKEPC